MQPIQDKVILRPIKPPTETVTASGIVILNPEVKSRFQLAEVVAVGPGRKMKKRLDRYPMSVEVGQKVFIEVREHGGTHYFAEDGTEYILIRDIDIFAVLS